MPENLTSALAALWDEALSLPHECLTARLVIVCMRGTCFFPALNATLYLNLTLYILTATFLPDSSALRRGLFKDVVSSAIVRVNSVTCAFFFKYDGKRTERCRYTELGSSPKKITYPLCPEKALLPGVCPEVKGIS